MELEGVLEVLEENEGQIGGDVNVNIDNPEESYNEPVPVQDESSGEDFAVGQVDEPIPVYLADAPQPVAAVASDVYPGSFSSTVYSYFEGIMVNNAGDDFVAWRASQDVYYLYWGDDFQVSGDTFSGSGSYVVYDSDYSGFSVSHGSGDFSVNARGGVLYTNVSDNYPSFPAVEQVQASDRLFFGFVVALGLWVAGRIMFR